MTESSARPDHLADFAPRTAPLDEGVHGEQVQLDSALSRFTSANRWGTLEASALVGNVGTWVELNKADARWVTGVGQAFRAADASGEVAYASGAEIASSLAAAGIASRGRADIDVEASVATGGQQTTGYANDPVSAASGNFIEVEVDLGFGPSLADLQLRRSYNSLDRAEGPFGAGWSSWASCRLQTDGTGAWANWRGPDGQVAQILLAEGTCPGFEGRVFADGSGLIAEFPKEAMFWRFDAMGRPTETSRGPGTRIRFEWDAQRLVAISHERGRRVDFEWDGSRIAAAVADDGRRVAYGYDPAGRLTAVDGPMGARRYEIDDAGFIASVADGDGVVAAANTYDERGRVLTQRSEFGRLSRFHYEPDLVTYVDDDDGGPVNRYEHDRFGRLTRVIDGHGAATTRDYDAQGRVVAVTDRNGAITRYEWDDRDRQVAMVEPDGVRTETTYDDLHRPVRVQRGPAVTTLSYQGEDRIPVEMVDPTGGVTRYQVADGLIARATDPDGVAVSLDYDTDGRVVAVTDGLGGVRRYEWDPSGQLAAVASPLGRRTSYERDAAGAVVAETTAGGDTWRYERSAAGRLTAVVDPTGARRTFELGEHGRAVAAVDELGARSTARYDSFGNVVTRSLADGGKWELSYDSLMRVVGVTDPSGASWLREHDAEGHLVATITPEGVRRSEMVDGTGRIIEIHDGLTSARVGYDELGRPVAQIRPDGTEAHGTYDDAGRLVSVTEPTGGTTRLRYSPAGRLIGVTGPEGGEARFDYDEAGRLVAATDANGATRRLRVDADGQVTRVTEATGEATGYGYDADGRIAAVTAADGGVTRYAYDPCGRLIAVTDPTGGVTTHAYDAAGRVVAVTDPNGATTTLERDINGRTVAETDPTGAVTRFRYDEMGRILEQVDPLGRRTEMTYDGSGRLVRRLDPDGRRFRWHYDESDRLASWSVDGEFEVRIDRDLLGREVRVADDRGRTVERTWTGDGQIASETTTTAAGTTTVAWRYDGAGRRTAYVVGDRTVSFGLDPGGRTTAFDDPDAGPIRLDRDAGGRIVEVASGGATETRRFDGGRLAGWARTRADGVTRTASFDRDAAGRITTVARSGAGTSTERAGYDAAGQLRTVAGDDGDWAFAYDPAGRLVSETAPAGPVSYAYDAAGQLTAIDRGDERTDITWDDGGRRLTEVSRTGERRYRYDEAGRLAAIASTRDGHTSTRTLERDPFGRVAGVDDTALTWDPVAAFDVLRAVGDHRLVGDQLPVGVVGPQADVSWFDTDQRGSVGTQDPYGAGTVGGLLPGGLGLGHGGELAVDDQLWMRERLYDPASRAFTSPDPMPGVLGQAAAANPYHFAANDPLNQLDPSGRKPLTEAQLDQIRSDWDKGAWDRYGGYVVGGLMIVGGVAVMATGVGGPIGAAMIGGALLGGGMSAGSQQYFNGSVSWGKVATDMAIGAAAGGFGAAAGGATTASTALTKLGPMGRGMVAGATDGLVGGGASRALNGENPFDPRGMGLDVLTGGTIGAAGGRLGTRNTSAQNSQEVAESMRGRADEIHSVLDSKAQGLRTTAVVRGHDAEGGVVDVVAVGRRRGLSPDQQRALHPPEVAAKNNPRLDAEQNALEHMHNNGITPDAGGTSRNVCVDRCQPAIEQSGGQLTGPDHPTPSGKVPGSGKRTFIWPRQPDQ